MWDNVTEVARALGLIAAMFLLGFLIFGDWTPDVLGSESNVQQVQSNPSAYLRQVKATSKLANITTDDVLLDIGADACRRLEHMTLEKTVQQFVVNDRLIVELSYPLTVAAQEYLCPLP